MIPWLPSAAMNFPANYRRAKRLSLTPLIDVIFLLLVFFMLSSHFYQYGAVNVAVTQSSGGTAGEKNDALMIIVDEMNTIQVQGQHFDLNELALAIPHDLAIQHNVIQLSIDEQVPVQTTLEIMHYLQQFEHASIQLSSS